MVACVVSREFLVILCTVVWLLFAMVVGSCGLVVVVCCLLMLYVVADFVLGLLLVLQAPLCFAGCVNFVVL